MTVRDPQPPSSVMLSLDEVERRHVLSVLEACGWNQTVAAEVLDVDRKTLRRRLVRWGVKRP